MNTSREIWHYIILELPYYTKMCLTKLLDSLSWGHHSMPLLNKLSFEVLRGLFLPFKGLKLGLFWTWPILRSIRRLSEHFACFPLVSITKEKNCFVLNFSKPLVVVEGISEREVREFMLFHLLQTYAEIVGRGKEI